MDEEVDERIGRDIGRWHVEKLLGSGGMATVYSAVDAAGQRVALKVLHPEMARRADVRERFLREAYVANRIGHPGVVRVVEHGQGTETFLAMELLDGEPLSARAQRPADFTLRELLGYTDQLLDVLAAAHDKGVVHRDIKPDNIYLTQDRRVKMLDFGIARVLDDVPSDFKTRTGLALGTIPYMAPEQALGRRGHVDGRTDLFALGALLFRILAGRRVHDEPSEAELLVAMATKPAPKLQTVAPNVPANVCAIVDTALAFSMEARYPDARTMQADVRAVLAGEVPPHAVTDMGAKRDAPTRIESAPRPAGAAGAPALIASPMSVDVPIPPPTQVIEQATLASVAAPVVAERAPTSARSVAMQMPAFAPAAVPAAATGPVAMAAAALPVTPDAAPGSVAMPNAAPISVAMPAAAAQPAIDAVPASFAPHSMAAAPQSFGPASLAGASLATPTLLTGMAPPVSPKKGSARGAVLLVLGLGAVTLFALVALGAWYVISRGTTDAAGAPEPAAATASAVTGEAASVSGSSDTAPTGTGPAAAQRSSGATAEPESTATAGGTTSSKQVSPNSTTAAPAKPAPTTSATSPKTLASPAPTATTPVRNTAPPPSTSQAALTKPGEKGKEKHESRAHGPK